MLRGTKNNEPLGLHDDIGDTGSARLTATMAEVDAACERWLRERVPGYAEQKARYLNSSNSDMTPAERAVKRNRDVGRLSNPYSAHYAVIGKASKPPVSPMTLPGGIIS